MPFYFPMLSNFPRFLSSIFAYSHPARLCDARVCAYCAAVLTRRGAKFHSRPVTTPRGMTCTRCGIAA